ncbi:tetratricopeptide repeat protein [Flavobacterium sp. SM2513]|uniref:tetratricopeptide repeat protein n=1 Tax=Flavobacterium sp. SM2513 TaxID=3424766 RepID=UPI003D7FBF93
MRYLVILAFFITFQTFASDFNRAEMLFQQEKFALAKPIFEKIITEEPKNYKAIEYLGDIAGHAKNWNEALGYYEKLKKADPKNADYQYKFGGALGMKAKEGSKFAALGMLGDVENAFLTAAKLDSKHIETRWALVEFYLQIPGILGGSEKKAQKFSNELLSISPVDGYLARGHIQEYFSRYLKAEPEYKKAFEIGQSKTTYQKLYNLYKNKLNQSKKAEALKNAFENKNTKK